MKLASGAIGDVETLPEGQLTVPPSQVCMNGACAVSTALRQAAVDPATQLLQNYRLQAKHCAAGGQDTTNILRAGRQRLPARSH